MQYVWQSATVKKENQDYKNRILQVSPLQNFIFSSAAAAAAANRQWRPPTPLNCITKRVKVMCRRGWSSTIHGWKRNEKLRVSHEISQEFGETTMVVVDGAVLVDLLWFFIWHCNKQGWEISSGTVNRLLQHERHFRLGILPNPSDRYRQWWLDIRTTR